MAGNMADNISDASDDEKDNGNVQSLSISPQAVNDSNLLEYLKDEEGFTEGDKLKQDMDSGNLKLQDILDCNESELKRMLTNEYQLKVVQTNRFVKAIKKLEGSKMNQDESLKIEEKKCCGISSWTAAFCVWEGGCCVLQAILASQTKACCGCSTPWAWAWAGAGASTVQQYVPQWYLHREAKLLAIRARFSTAETALANNFGSNNISQKKE